MYISKEDGIAQLAKWYDGKTRVNAIYRSVSVRLEIIGIIEELSASGIKVVGPGAEVLLSFTDTSNYQYEDSRAPDSQSDDEVANKYPIFIKVTFSTGDHLEVSEYCLD